MTGQQKEWLKRFVDMGEAGKFITDYLLDVNIKDEGQTDANYGAQVRAMASLKKGVEQRHRDMKIVTKDV